jgi:hypothetical protein
VWLFDNKKRAEGAFPVAGPMPFRNPEPSRQAIAIRQELLGTRVRNA